ncbi:hypothetical protein GNF86_01645 [Clostridium perfringens]
MKGGGIMQFRKFYFEFDGKKSKDRNLKMVVIDNKSEEDKFGVEQEIIEEDNGTDTPLFLGIKRKPQSLKISIMKMNKYSRPLPYTDKELDEICRWLFKKEYKPFIPWDNTGMVYYVIFTKGTDFFNCAKEGYINLEMRLNAPYGYSNLFNNDYRIKGEKVIDIYNGSDIDNFIYPDIEFELRDNSTDLTIKNLSLGETMEFNNLVSNDHIMIYNEGLKDMVSLKDKSRNIFQHSNKQFIKLQYGLNRIQVKGNCRIRFLYQYPIGFK